MAVTGFWYGKAFLSAFGGAVNFLSDSIKCMLTTATYVPAQDTHQYKSDVTNEVSGTGYTATGVVLANKTLTYTAGTNVVMFDADDAVWAGATITARVAVVYDATPGSDATRPLLVYQLSDADIVASGGEFRVQWAAAGIATVTPA